MADTRQKPKQMATGIPGLDQVLEGGFLYHNSILFKGPPGSGKTTLGIQVIYNGAAIYDEPGIIVLFEQFPQQLFRDLSAYDWDFKKLVEEKRLAVVFAEPSELVSHDRISDSPLISKIQDAALETGAKRILIDGLSHLLKTIHSTMDEREMLLRFINLIKSMGLTPILTAEKENLEGQIGFDEYLTDCVVLLSSEAGHDKTFPVRTLEVRKTRGHGHLRGKHPYRIGSQGIEVFPHRLPQSFVSNRDDKDGAQLEKASSGLVGLNDLLGGGYTRGTATLLTGMPGAYKTTFGAQFLIEGAKNGERGLFLTFNENPAFLCKVMGQKGLDLQSAVDSGKVGIWHLFPKTFYMDELYARLEKEFAGNGVKRVVVDGLNEFEKSIEDPDTYKDYLASFLSLMAQFGVTSVYIQKLDQVSSGSPLASIRYAETFDGIIYAGTIEIESAVKKMVSVLKMRGADYSTDLREIHCGGSGLQVANKFFGMSGILAGNPQGQYKKTVEDIFQPLYFIRDFIEILATPDADPEMKAQVAGNIKTEAAKLAEKLEVYFDIGKKK